MFSKLTTLQILLQKWQFTLWFWHLCNLLHIIYCNEYCEGPWRVLVLANDFFSWAFLVFLFNTCTQIMAALWDSHSKFPEGAWHYSVAPHNWVILGGSWATPFKNCLGVGFERAAGKERGPRQIGFGGSRIHYHHNKLRWNKHNSHLLPLLRSGAKALQTSNQE